LLRASLLLGSLLVLELWARGVIGLGGGDLAGLRAERADLLATASDGESPTPIGRQQRTALHPYFGYSFDADAISDGNLQGLLGPDPTSPAEPGEFRVWISGGSVAANLYLEARQQLRERLAADPRLADRRVRLFSLAVGGFKQPQPLMAAQYLLALGARVDLVLHVDGFNELALGLGNRLTRVSLFYPSGWPGYTTGLLGAEERSLAARLAQAERLRRLWARATAGPVVGTSALGALFWRLGDRVLARDATRLSQRLDRELASSSEAFFRHGDVRDETRDEAITRIAGLWVRSSLALAALGRARGFAYLHVLQPNQYVPGSKPLSAEERALYHRPEHNYAPWIADGYRAYAERFPALRGAGVALVDGRELFREVPETLYRDDCCHLNERGRSLLIDAILEAVATLPLPAASPPDPVS
jgi:hypothetical protein